MFKRKCKVLIFFLEYNWVFFYSIIHTHHVIKLSKLQKYVFQHYKVRKRKLIEKDDPKLPKKRKVSGHYEEGEAPVKFIPKVEEYYRQIFYQAIHMVANCIHNRF